MITRTALLAACALGCAVPALGQDQPLSAIEWLDDVAQQGPAPIAEPQVSAGVALSDITVSPLDGTTPRQVGLVPSATTGFPASLWRGSDGVRLARRLQDLHDVALPATQALYVTLLLSQVDPPDTGADAFNLGRVAALQRLGAIDPAWVLIEQAGIDASAAHLALAADVALLAGRPEPVCAALQSAPGLAVEDTLRVYCLARSGDWNMAVLVLGTSEAIGDISTADGAALARFLDPELFEGEPDLARPPAMTPLRFRLFEAIGQRLPTAPLPRGYAFADLDGSAGWKAQIAAAERLSLTSAVSANRLAGIYSDGRPAASGGVWDRLRAWRALDAAAAAGDARAVAATLPPAWDAARAARLAVPFAAWFADLLPTQSLFGRAADIAYDVMLLSPDYERAAERLPDRARANPLRNAITRGDSAAPSAASPIEQAIAGAFDGTIPPDAELLASEDGLGMALLNALIMLEDGAAGDAARLGPALATLRALGLEDTARRSALQILVLGRTS